MDDESFTALRLERIGPVLRVTIDNPASELNTVDERLHHELTALFAALRDERDARAVVLTGDPLTAHEAERIGLVNRVVPAAELDAAAMAFADRLAAGAPLAVRYTKLAVNKLVKEALNVAFDTSTALELLTFPSDDHQEALRAMREKRAPEFRGR